MTTIERARFVVWALVVARNAPDDLSSVQLKWSSRNGVSIDINAKRGGNIGPLAHKLQLADSLDPLEGEALLKDWL